VLATAGCGGGGY